MEQGIEKILALVLEAAAEVKGQDKPAGYIPALAEVDCSKFGMAVSTIDGNDFVTGYAEERFSIQNLSKVFSLSLAIHYTGEGLFERVGVESSGMVFNSLSQLEYEQDIPRNPFINTGALVTTEVLLEHLNSPKQDFLDFVRRLSNSIDVHYDEQVFRSEYDNGNRNAVFCNYLKSFGNIKHNIFRVLDFYFYQYALSMSCLDQAKAFHFLVQDGECSFGKDDIASRLQLRRINSLMMICGTYDEAGEFAFRVGLPCKSGIGGGIVAIMPGGNVYLCLGGPKGNSLAGIEALECFVQRTGDSVF